MVGKSRQFDAAINSALPSRQGYAEYLGCLHSILAENFIEIADTEKKNGIGMFLFHLPILLQQRLVLLLNLLGKRLFFRRFSLYILLWCRCRCRLHRARRWRFDTVGIIQFQIKAQAQRIIERSPQVAGYADNTPFVLVDDSRFAVRVGSNFCIGAYHILRERHQVLVTGNFRTSVNNRLDKKFLISR